MTSNVSISCAIARTAPWAALLETGGIENHSLLRDQISALAGTVIREALGGSLRALVLTGSMARDEAGFDVMDGRCKVRGDAEFLVVLKDNATNIPPRQQQAVLERLQTELVRAGIDCQVSAGFITGKYFSNIRPHIFGYELKRCGVVITGDADILTLIPEMSPKDIPLEDAWQLLSNRIVEFTGFAHEWIIQPQRVSIQARYRMVKLYLDMATSYLLFESRYQPTYVGRAQALRAISQASVGQKENHAAAVTEFSRIVSLCTRFKTGHNLEPDEEVKQLLDQIGNPESLGSAVNLAHCLWRWEATRLAGLDKGMTDEQLMRQLMKLQPIVHRLRGWAYVLRRSGWHRSWKQWPRWARSAWKASPRHWIYSAAAELFFSLPNLIKSHNKLAVTLDYQRMRSCLIIWNPFPNQSLSHIQQLCFDIAANYRDFLEGTRA